jgi:hypothetical protein
MSELSRRLDAAVKRAIDTPPTPLVDRAPKDFQPGVKYVGGRLDQVTTGPVAGEVGPEDYEQIVADMGVTVPEGFRLVLDEAKFDPAAWHRDEAFWIDEQGNQRKTPAQTRPIWRYRFKVVSAVLAGAVDEDLAKLMADARKVKRGKAAPAVFDKSTFVVVLGDIQAGKVDRRGGTAELLDRLEYAKGEVVKRARKLKPHQIVIIDGGDAMENFESSPGADRTNDLQLTQQMRLWRRVFWDWVSSLSQLAAEIDVLAVPSNHCSVRRGKQNMSTPGDDYGIEVLSQLADIAAENDAYAHVQFWSPEEHEEALALTLVGGKTVGVVHGHQMRNPDLAPKYLAGQALGRTPLGGADIVIVNHFHNFWVKSVGRGLTMFGAPTMDSGSSWFANLTGEESDPAVLTFVVDELGWRDLHLVSARAGVDYEVLS